MSSFGLPVSVSSPAPPWSTAPPLPSASSLSFPASPHSAAGASTSLARVMVSSPSPASATILLTPAYSSVNPKAETATVSPAVSPGSPATWERAKTSLPSSLLTASRAAARGPMFRIRVPSSWTSASRMTRISSMRLIPPVAVKSTRRSPMGRATSRKSLAASWRQSDSRKFSVSYPAPPSRRPATRPAPTKENVSSSDPATRFSTELNSKDPFRLPVFPPSICQVLSPSGPVSVSPPSPPKTSVGPPAARTFTVSLPASVSMVVGVPPVRLIRLTVSPSAAPETVSEAAVTVPLSSMSVPAASRLP